MKYWLLIFILTGCSKFEPISGSLYNPYAGCTVPTFANATRRLVVFGDSNTQGVADPVNGCPYSYAYKVSTDKTYDLLNLAIGGSRINMNGQLPTAMVTQFETSDIVVFIAGYNDMRNFGTNQNDLDAFEEYLKDFCYIVSPQVHQLIIGTTPQMAVYSPQNASRVAQAKYAQTVRNVIHQINLPNVTMVDLALMSFTKADFEPDLVHFTPETQNTIATLIEGSIQ
jgi:lysophospholipase L1-like esterase